MSSTVAPIYIRATNKFIIRGFELISTGTSATIVNAGNFDDCDLEIVGCRISGGLNGAGTARAGAKIHIENCVVSGAFEFGIRGASIGVTASHTVVTGCNVTGSAFRAGIQTSTGAAFDSVVSYNNNGNDDWYTPNGSLTFCASGDTSVHGSNSVTGIVGGDFTNTASNIWTSNSGGALSGAGSGGTDIGLNLIAANVVLLLTPVENTLIQRDLPANTASILITGTYSGPLTPAAIEASFNGGGFVTIDASPTAGTYSGTITGQASGNGDLIVRFTNDISVNHLQGNIAIGAKFLAWGQSNFSGRATNAQAYTGTAGFFHKYTVTNDLWEIGADPFDTQTVNGSLFPILANIFVANLGVPVAFVGVAQGSTSLAQWQLGQTYNNRMLDYIANSGGNDMEGILSWIGETDGGLGTAEATFKSEYNAIIDQLQTLTGAKSVLCGIATVGAAYDNIRQWIGDIVNTNASALQYVDMGALFSQSHYITDQETADAAQALFDGMNAAFFSSILNLMISGIPDGTFMTVLDDSNGNRIQRQNETFSSEAVSISLMVDVGTTVKGYVDDNSNPSTDGAYIEGITE